jgi:hypothetical protein
MGFFRGLDNNIVAIDILTNEGNKYLEKIFFKIKFFFELLVKFHFNAIKKENQVCYNFSIYKYTHGSFYFLKIQIILDDISFVKVQIITFKHQK